MIEPGKRGGKPTIRGLRITVYDVLEYLASGRTKADILESLFAAYGSQHGTGANLRLTAPELVQDERFRDWFAPLERGSMNRATAEAATRVLRELGVEVRAGLHTGEVEVRGEDVGGIAVHIAARVTAEADPSEILVSGSVPPLVAGSGIEFLDRGVRPLKGVPGEWRLFSVSR